jgi:hypothetical protein
MNWILRDLPKEKENLLWEFLKFEVNRMTAYHNHKERLAHAGVLVLLAIVGLLATKEIHLPPEGLGYWMSFAAMVVFVSVTFSFIRFQSIRRREAAILVSAMLFLLIEKTQLVPNIVMVGNLDKDRKDNSVDTHNNKFRFYLNFIWPIKNYAHFAKDSMTDKYPISLRNKLAEVREKSTDAIIFERFIVGISYFLVVFSIFFFLKQ